MGSLFARPGRGRVMGWAALAALMVAMPAAVHAQEDEWVRSFYNLERSHIDHPLDRGLIFEAQISPQIIVAQRLADLFTGGDLTREPRASAWGYSFSIAPMVRLRMIDEASQPVRTPSYMPHGVGQLFFLRNLNGSDVESERMRGPFEMWTAQLRVSHHSNGQDGCLYTTQSKRELADGSFECEFRQGYAPQPEHINRADGSFSKNFVRGGVFFRRLYLPEGLDDTVRWSWYGGVTAETHKSFLVNWMPGTIPEDQEVLYGSWRWRLLAGMSFRHDGRLPGGHYLDVVYERYPNAADVLTKYSFSAEYIRSFRRFGGWGLYLRYFRGQDYYNLGFGQTLARISVGLAWVQERFETVGASGVGFPD